MPGTLVEIQESQVSVGLLLCPSFIPFGNCGMHAALWTPRGGWCPGLSQWHDRTGKDVDMYAPATGRAQCDSKGICNQVLSRKTIIATPG